MTFLKLCEGRRKAVHEVHINSIQKTHETWKRCQERNAFQRTAKSAFQIELGRNQSETGILQRYLNRELYIIGAVQLSSGMFSHEQCLFC